MIEGRATVPGVGEAKTAIERLGGVFNSNYAFKDIIFVPKKANYNLSDDFLRARVYIKSNWPTKKVVLIRKQTEFKEVGKVDHIVLRQEFDTEQEALDYIKQELGTEFEYGFEYSREGWQYTLEGHLIFVENVEGLKPSIEIEADTDEQLQNFFDRIGAVERFHDSVPELVRRIKMGRDPSASN